MYKKGLIKEVIIIIIALIILGYVFHISIIDILNNPQVQANLGWVWHVITVIWSWISTPIMFIWNTFVIGVIWNSILAGLH